MPFPLRLPEQVQNFIDDVKIALEGFFFRVADIADELRERLLFGADRLLEKVPPEKRRVVLIGSMGGLAVLLLIFAGAVSSKDKAAARQPAGAEETARQGFIPPDEVFLPDEPDFVPGVMREREQRTAWTAEEAKELWQDPLKDGEEPWRNAIEKAIDDLMESVP